MNRRAVWVMGIVIWGLLLHSGGVVGGGLYFGLPFYSLDLEGTFTQAPDALEGATAALEDALLDLGLSPIELEEIHEAFADAVDAVEETLQGVPTLVPVPMIGGAIEISLPMHIIDSVRVTGGLLNDSLLRSLARIAGTEIPKPLFEADFDLEELALSGSTTVDLAFSSWMLSTELVKRFDLLVLGFVLGGGLDLIGGEIRPLVDIELPAEYRDGVDDALAALHLDELTWSTVAMHAVLGVELGPPFLRVYGDLRVILPLSQRVSWWEVRVADFAGVVGIAILF